MTHWVSVVALLLSSCLAAFAQDVLNKADQLEKSGDPMAAHVLLQRAANAPGAGAATLAAYAGFLDRYNDPETRAVYEKLLAAEQRPADKARAARRLVLLDLLEGDREAAGRHLREYHAAGGRDWPSGLPAAAQAPAGPAATIEIPGPLRSFSRMAALSPETAVADVLPALARNVVTNGYQASSGAESLEPTEYMKLIQRYLSQARELERLAGEERSIRIAQCDSPQTGELIRILGYRMRGACGSDLVLETVNASRAFLTIDSGFPLARLEQDLRTNRPFTYEYAPARVPVLYGPEYWLTAKDKQSGGFIDAFLGDPSLARLYLGLSKLDRETADAIKANTPMPRLKPFAHVLDFFGGMFAIRNGKAVTPGGARSAAMWAEMAGVSPEKGPAFFERLIMKDDGWMASYFDALARISGPVQEYLTEPARMNRFYQAIRGRVTSPGPARPVFRANTDMMLLTTRLRLDPDGRPHIPGGIEVWKNFFINHPHGKYDGKLTRLATAWKEPDDVLEALFALCRKSVENEPLKVFMALSDLDRQREKPLAPATVDRLAREFRSTGSQYAIFSEAPALADQTILQFLDAVQAINRIGDLQSRADAAGTMQALVGLWQIFTREDAIPRAQADQALAGVIAPFLKARADRELFEAGRGGVELLLKAAQSNPRTPLQDRMMELLAGTAKPADSEYENQVIQDMVRIFEAQRLISLNLLFEMADHLDALGRGEKPNLQLVNRVAARIGEIQLPRASLTAVEKNAFSFGYWTDRHIDTERKLNLRSAIERAGSDAEKLREIRGQLAPLLRDTLVGLNYVHYAPPGAQLLLSNPVFVRSHDFIGLQSGTQTWRNTEVMGTGWPSSAGGKLIGSLSGLPYALAEAEQNFLVPTREQALIWGDLAPQLIISAKIPRWWNVTPEQMHWVGLHMRLAESLLAASALDPKVREEITAVLNTQAAPARAGQVAALLRSGDVRGAIEKITPAEMFFIAADAVKRGSVQADPFAAEIRHLREAQPDRVNYEAISRAFGTPKPTLTNSYKPELLHLRTFPTLMGYSSRIMAESWESSTLYWAALADQVHLPPAQLNLLIPEWTQKTLEKIFATHLEDWPALLRSLRSVGEDARLKLRLQMDAEQKASLN